MNDRTTARDQLLRTLSPEELNALEPVSSQRLEAARVRAETERNAVRRAEQSTQALRNLCFR